MKKYLVALLVTVVAVPSVSFAAGLTQSQIDAILSLLRSFNADQSVVSNVETALTGAKPPVSNTFCYNWEKNLRVGDGQRIDTGLTGAERDIGALYTALGKYEGIFDYEAVAQPGALGSSMRTSYFSEQLASYVVQFQEKYRNEILTPNGLSHGTGYVGVSTRAKLNRLFGCSVNSNRPPVISGLDAPTTLAVGEVGTWAVKASDPEGSSLSYSVVWGDEVSAGTSAMTPSAERPFIQTATFTHSYGTAGVYTPVFYVKDTDGHEAKTSVTVRVGSGIGTTVSEQVKCVFNGSTSEQKCYAESATWVRVGQPSVQDVMMWSCSGVGSCVVNVKGPSGSQITWKSSCGGDKLPITTLDGQNEYANFSCDTTTQPSITVLSPNGGESWQKGTTQTIKWQDNTPLPPCSTDQFAPCLIAPRYYDLKLAPYYPPCTTNICPAYPYREPYPIANGVSGNSTQWYVGKIIDSYGSGAIAPDGAYTVQVCQSGTNTCDSSDLYFKIYSPNTTTSTNIY